MIATIRPALVLLLLFTAITGIAYPLLVTGLTQMALPAQANGSLIAVDGRTVGSRLIGQAFTSPHYFAGRPSAAGEKGYDASGSSGSNLGPLSKKLLDRVAQDVDALKAPGLTLVPADALTTSASGLDPHISPAFAMVQVDRVARARDVSADQVRAVVLGRIEAAGLGVIGEPRINVLMLNLALDARFGKPNG